MRPAFLLDENVDPRLAGLLARDGVDAISLCQWQNGGYVSSPDREILLAAELEGRVLITHDVSSIPSVLEDLGAAGINHAGVVFVSWKTLESRSISSLARALENLVNELGDVDWRNRMVFLRR
jgi:predicted nuclease of predicted toxin-antitoxin system